MTWDDHEIYDGWGSHGDEQSVAQRTFFQAAAEAFESHQMVHNPGPLAGAGRAAGDHRAFCFAIGNVAFLVLDLRTNRNVKSTSRSSLVGEKQWDDIETQLAKWREAGTISHLAVVTSVPPVFTDRWLTGAPKWLVRGGKDDLLDQWGSPPNRNDQARLLGTLLEFRRQVTNPCNILILGGDVHVAGAGGVRSDAPRFLRSGERVARIYQLISSAIGYSAPSGLTGSFLLSAVEGDHVLGPDLTGHISKSYLARNFSIVHAARKDNGFRVDLHLEDQPAPVQHHFADVPTPIG
jgi:phosphodiesterase/alkaline phosphatase D-like protein